MSLTRLCLKGLEVDFLSVTVNFFVLYFFYEAKRNNIKGFVS